MLQKEYYCLVAGLPDLFFNENKLTIDCLSFKNELQYQLSKSDFELVKLLFLTFDNLNFRNIFFNLDKPFNQLGNYSKEHIDFQLTPDNEHLDLPEYIIQFLNWMKEIDDKQFNIQLENKLLSLFYAYVLKSRNKFLRNWFMFELNTKNILTAFNCIKFNYNLQKQLLHTPQNTLTYSLLLQKRLKPELFEDELPFAEQVFKVADSHLIRIEKEKALDKIRWDYLDDTTFFHYFTIEKILSFIIKLMITERWIKVDTETGKELLNRLINDLKKSYEFPVEFSLIKKI